MRGQNAISWFEAPINLETKEHIDAVVFDLERKVSILIEAKRFSNPGKKIIEVKSDIDRLKNPENHKVLERELRDVTIEVVTELFLQMSGWKQKRRKRFIKPGRIAFVRRVRLCGLKSVDSRGWK